MRKEQLITQLNNNNSVVRLDALKELMELVKAGEIEAPRKGNDVNIHTHTIYSFSPYSPTKAVWMAYTAGLEAVGIMDHDSIGGAREFLEAGKIAGMRTTIGAECRASLKNTPLGDRVINTSDQKGIAYCTIHGVPHQHIDKVIEFFKPYTEHRNARNRKMIARMNELLAPHGISLDFEKDVILLSKYMNGGSITERHLLSALAKKIVRKCGIGVGTVSFLEKELHLSIGDKAKVLLIDEKNPYYENDLLGVLKSGIMKQVYIEATKECPDVADVIALANQINAYACYVYSGGAEDAYLDTLFEVLKDLGFKAVSYMPSRNSMEQIKRIQSMCDRYGLIQLSGEEINSPRQSFICEEQRNPEVANLYETAMNLIRHEWANTVN